MIPFNRPPFVGKEPEYIKQVIESRKLCGDGAFTRRCHEWIRTGNRHHQSAFDHFGHRRAGDGGGAL